MHVYVFYSSEKSQDEVFKALWLDTIPIFSNVDLSSELVPCRYVPDQIPEQQTKILALEPQFFIFSIQASNTSDQYVKYHSSP